MNENPLQTDEDGFFTLQHDITDDIGGTIDTGAEMKLLDSFEDEAGEVQVRIRPKHHQEGDGFIVPLARLL